MVQLEQHTLKLASPEATFEADCHSAIQLQWCLQRRALALDQVRLSSWECQSKWINQLLTTLNSSPPQGHARVTMEQLVRADKQLWTELSKAYAGAVVAAVGADDPPFDDHILRLRNDPRVTMYLLPLPQLAKGSGASAAGSNAAGDNKPSAKAKPQPKKKFKATRKADKNKPEVLAGMDTITKDGHNICWAYNMENGCQAATVSGAKPPRCAKGLHVCAFCHKPNHSQLVCNLKKRNN